jgi:hypothetical protein
MLDRILARLRARSIDDRLLAGEPPDATAETRVRRDMLLDPRYREEVADALRRMADAAYIDGPRLFGASLHLRKLEVREARSEILALAAEVDEDPTVRPRGVIMADRLIRDGDSPVFWPCDDSVELAVRHARAALHLG